MRTQLRIKVLAGVVAVTLVALVAFDVGAVTTVRRYLLSQSDSNLQVALTLTLPRLAEFLAASTPGGGPRGTRAVPAQRYAPPKGRFLALPGAYDMTFLPSRGDQVTLQEAVNVGAAGFNWHLTPTTAKLAAAPGLHILTGPDGAQLQVRSLRVPGGSLVVGTSLDQVYETIVRVELVVIIGSMAVCCSSAWASSPCCAAGCGRSRRWPRKPTGSRPATSPSGSRPQHPGSEVGGLSAALNGMLARIEAAVDEPRPASGRCAGSSPTPAMSCAPRLASLRANAELYQQGALGSPDEVDEVMDRIVLESLRYGPAGRGHAPAGPARPAPRPTREPVDLTDLVNWCVDRARVADPERTWHARIAAGPGTVGDEELLRRAIDNLIMNVQSTPPPAP